MSTTRAVAALAGVAALTIGVTGCGFHLPGSGSRSGPGDLPTPSARAIRSGTHTPRAPDPNEPAGNPAYATYYTQRPVWTACRQSFECSTVTVPMDWANPAGTSIGLAVMRHPAVGTKVGSLLINPGGPGASGLAALKDAATDFGRPLRGAFDLVSWDPRGVGMSHPVTCLSDQEMDAYTASDSTPDTPAEIIALQADDKKFAASCRTTPAGLIAHIDTISTAKDLDVLRAVVGDDTLNYLGFSYGTSIGAWYAQLFPGRVGRVVLDGPVDPSLNPAEAGRTQAHGFTRALDSFITTCLPSPKCPLQGTPAQAKQQVIALADRLDAQPQHTTLHRELTESLLETGLAEALYSRDLWSALAQGLHDAFAGDGTVMLQLSDLYYQRDRNGHYGPLLPSNAAISCLDTAETRTPAQIAAEAAVAKKVDPLFGDSNAWDGYGCLAWPSKGGVVPTRKLTAAGAAPILVVGTTKDPATPFEWAEALAGQLTSGVLLTREGDGHTAYGSGSTCTDTAIEDYLTQGIVPPTGTVCS